jgi:hypothetical protein
MQPPCIARALRFQKYVLHTSGSPDRSKSPENNFQASLTSKSPKCIYICIYIFIYIHKYIDIRRVVLTQQVSQACLPSKSAKQVFQVYIYIYIYVFIYICIPVFQQVFQAISTIPQPWSSSVTITRPNHNNQIRTTRTN